MANSKNQNRIRKTSTRKPPKNSKNKKRTRSFDFNIFSLIMMGLSAFLFIFILSSNTGKLGNAITNWFTISFGKISIIMPVIIFISFLFAYRDKYKENLGKFLLLYLVFLLTLGFLSKDLVRYDLSWTIDYNKVHASLGGGILGGYIAYYLVSFIGTLGLNILYIISVFLFLVGISPLTYSEFFVRFRNLIVFIANKISSFVKDQNEKIKESRNEDEEISVDTLPNDNKVYENPIEDIEERKEKEDFDQAFDEEAVVKRAPIKAYDFDKDEEVEVRSYKSKQIEMKDLDEGIKKEFDNYNYPTIDLLEDRTNAGSIDEQEIKNKALAIEETLESFGIGSKVVQIDVGPTVTCYELKPQRGVKVSKILNLSDDLALSLATSGIRILAPIPGKSHVGIEVPNKSKEIVGFKEIISTSNFQNAKSKIPFAMGKSISGDPIVSGIEKMPHLLVSGATGSGKSVCINTIIMSILYKHSPDEVKLLMIDPKVVELSVYNGIPHLIMPVITDPKKASSSLFWAISEMEKRYKAFQKYHVRDIAVSYTHLTLPTTPYV